MAKLLPVFLVAGIGTRLNDHCPKCLIEINNKPLIFHSILALKKLDIEEIVIVVGHKKEEIINMIGNEIFGIKVHYVNNEEFNQTGTAFSFLCARSIILKKSIDILMIHGDILYDPKIFNANFPKDESIIFLDSNYKTSTHDEMVVFGREKKVQSIIKGPKTASLKNDQPIVLGESLGINIFRSKILNNLFKNLENIISLEKKIHWEQTIEALVKNYDFEFHYYDIAPLQWVNINYADDLRIANKLNFS